MNKLLAPIRAIRAEYIPLLVIYFTTGLMGMVSVSSTLFFKDIVKLPAETLIELSVYISLPWSVKMIFGSLIDSVKLFGNNRKNYIYLGQLLVAAGLLGMVDNASTGWIFAHFGEYLGILIPGLLGTTGVVISDIVADVMALETVPDSPTKDKDLGMVQVLSRLSLSIGAVVAALLTGFLATHYQVSTVHLIALICPVIAIIATLWATYDPLLSSVGKLNKSILIGGLFYGVFVILAGTFLNQEVVFFGSFSIILFMTHSILKSFPTGAKKTFIYAMIAIFLFRVVPGIGPAGGWWYMNELGFDADFMGTLQIIANVSGLVVLWLLADSITNHSIFRTMLVLTVFITVLSLPDLLVYYDYTFGMSAKTLILADTAMIAPLARLSMIPLGVLIAKNAPSNTRAVYISVTASLMNISLVGGDIITKALNKLFIVTRDDFSQLGNLMIYSLIISTVLSIIGLVLLKMGERR